MGNLTNDMTRLRGEVDAMRGVRGALVQDLARGTRDLAVTVSAMRVDFAAAHAAMAKQTRGEREAFVVAGINEVNSLLDAFSRDRVDMARKGAHYRGVFLSEMRIQVACICKDTADDLKGARLAWRGRSPGKSMPVPMKNDPVVVKPVSYPVEATLQKMVAASEIKEEKPPVTFREPLKEEEKKTAVMPKDPVVEPPKVKTPATVFASVEVPKQKEKSRLYEKPAKTSTKGKRDKK